MIRSRRYIYKLGKRIKSEKLGNKARSLLFLSRHKYRIPETWVITTDAFDEYLNNGKKFPDDLLSELKELPPGNYAIRSSTDAEDSDKCSFAGMFQTLTNICGSESIVNSIKKVWDSAISETNNEYQTLTGETNREIKCAVVVQHMVESRLSGVSFSKNPLTGLSDMIVEAVEGQGEDLVQKGITPYRWRFRGDTLVEGDPDFEYFNIIKSVADATARLKKLFRNDADIEWAYDGNNINYLQIRRITGKNRINIYSNRMAREMLPGQIKPLVWSVNIPLVNGTWIRILSEITGKLNVKPEDLAKSFYYRVYFNMLTLGTIFREFGLPAESLEFMLLSDESKKPSFKPGIRTFRHTFRIIRFIISKLSFEPVINSEYDSLKTSFEGLAGRIEICDPIEDFDSIYNDLFQQGGRIAYLNIIVPILMQLHNKIFQSRLSRAGYKSDSIAFHEDFPQLKKLSPHYYMNSIRERFEKLPEETRNMCKSARELSEHAETSDLAEELDHLIKLFGHYSISGNDFSYIKWQEDPEMVYKMILNSAPLITGKSKLRFSQIRYSRFKHPLLGKAWKRAGRFQVYREKISSLYIFGYGLFRVLFLRLTKELVRMEVITETDDIFYLTKEELDGIIGDLKNRKNVSFRDIVEGRKREMKGCADIALPTVIYGDHAPVFERENIKNIRGTGTSSGVFRGRVRKVTGIEDFGTVKNGDILIIPFSDVSWSSVLLKAGAIVSESGGMLSHCSIIAREMGIPALVSVENACQLENGLEATVDGSNGILTIH